MQAVESGIKMKVQELMNSIEVQNMMETVLQQEMDSAIQNIAEELGLDSTNTDDPTDDEVDGAIENLE